MITTISSEVEVIRQLPECPDYREASSCGKMPANIHCPPVLGDGSLSVTFQFS